MIQTVITYIAFSISLIASYSKAQCATITGRAMDEHEGIIGAYVKVFAGSISSGVDSQSALDGITTDYNGNFVFNNLARAKSYILQVKAIGYADTTITVDVVDSIFVEIRTHPCLIAQSCGYEFIKPGPLVIVPGKSAILGEVRNKESGAPISKAYVDLSSVFKNGCSEEHWALTSTSVDSMGNFVIGNRRPGSHTLYAHAEGFAYSPSVTIEIVADSTYTINFELMNSSDKK